MSSIKFRLVKFEKRIAFEIIEQIQLPKDSTYILPNGVKVITFYPYIEEFKSNNTIYIRNVDKAERDNRISVASFLSNDERDFYYDKLLISMRELAEIIKP